jgi:aminopeptidase
MKSCKTFYIISVLAVINILLFSSVAVLAQEVKFDELARTVITTSANIKPGHVVVVYGGKHTIPSMEALAIEAGKAGGMVNMFLDSDKVLKSYYQEVDEKYLDQEPTYFAEWLKHIDVWIGLPGSENPKAVFVGIPEERFAKVAKAGQIINDMLNESGVRLVNIGYPTKEQAAINQLDFAAYEKMHWDAVKADYNLISQNGNKLKTMLQGAKKVTVTSPFGTHFTFSVGERPVFVDDGIVTEEEAKGDLILARYASLPGGSVFFAPIESSAKGKVVVPKHRCRYAPLIGVTFELIEGKLHNFVADEGAKCFEETMAPYTGPKDMFGYFSIGLNPALKVIEEGGDYRPGNAAGMVWIGFGDNRIVGGNNKTQGGFSFPLVNATVEIDGKIVVKKGNLTL